MGWIVWGLGCGKPYQPVDHTTATFPLLGAHALATCEGCHGSPPFGPITWDTTCLSCHEADRKSPDHYPGQGCASGGGCHAEADLSWAEGNGAGDHSFLPIDGAHDLPCVSCHASETPSAADALGTAALCWSCHEDDRKDATHYVENLLVFLAEPRWDCKACHDSVSRIGVPIDGWGDNEGDHGSVRFPHGMFQNGALVAFDAWIVDCTDCHVDEPPIYECTTSCHAELFTYGPHNGADPGDDFTCLGCHPYADRR